jgi:heptosyltransferase-2
MRILVIRLKHVGDCLLALPVCSNLKQAFPGATVDYLVLDHIAPLFRSHPDIDRVVTISPAERRHTRLYLKKLLELRRRRYDVVLDLRTDSITVLITLFTDARRQIGFDRGKWRSRLYKTRVPYPEAGGSLNAKLSILKALSIAKPLDTRFAVHLSHSEVESMRGRMRGHGIEFSRPVFVFATVGRVPSKTWPVEYFVEVIENVLERYAAQGILIWGPGEEERVRAVTARIDRYFNVHADIGTGSDDVRELAALLANSTIFIGNDGGPRHIAEAVGKPTFTIFSPLMRKAAWLPHPGPRHRAVDLEDALGADQLQRLDREEVARRQEFYHRKVTPPLVLARLIPMLDELCAESETTAVGRRIGTDNPL